MKEAADLVMSGKAKETVQDESQASYEGWCRDPEAKINWHNHIDQVYNLIRGLHPGAGCVDHCTTARSFGILEARKHPARTFSAVKGKIGAVTDIGERSIFVSTQGGQIEVLTLRPDDGKKLSGPEFCAQAGVAAGTILGA